MLAGTTAQSGARRSDCAGVVAFLPLPRGVAGDDRFNGTAFPPDKSV